MLINDYNFSHFIIAEVTTKQEYCIAVRQNNLWEQRFRSI